MPVTHILQYKGGTGAIPSWKTRGVSNYTSWGLAASEHNEIWGIWFKPDGTKMYTAGDSSFTLGGFEYQVREFTLSTPWDVGTRSAGTRLHDGVQSWNNPGLSFNPQGNKMYLAQSGTIWQYTLGTDWVLSTAGATPVTTSGFVGSIMGSPKFNLDGTKMFILTDIRLLEYNLSTPYDVTTRGGIVNEITMASIGLPNTQHDMFFNTEGSEVYFVETNQRFWYVPINGTNYSLDSMGTAVQIGTNILESQPREMFMDVDGQYIYYGHGSRTVHRHDMTTI